MFLSFILMNMENFCKGGGDGFRRFNGFYGFYRFNGFLI